MKKNYLDSFLLSLLVVILFQNHVVQADKLDVFARKPMRILMVVDRFPWFTKQPIINQAIGLLQRGHDVRIFSQERKEGYTTPTLEKYQLVERTYFEFLPQDLDAYDVIIFQYGYLAKEYAYLKKEYNLKAKFVTFFRGADITSSRQTAPHVYDEVFEVGDLFLPICEYFRFRLIIAGCDPSKIAVQYSGVDVSKFNFKERIFKKGEKIRFLTVGRLIEKKGLEYVFEAIKTLTRRYKNIEYCIVGDGPRRKALEKLSWLLGLEKKIHFVGWKSHAEIVEMLHNSHIFISPSVTSRGGIQDAPINVLKEAMLTGMPVISSYHGGIIELVIDQKSGLLVPERDVDSLTRCIKYLIDYPEKWNVMGKAGRKKVKRLFDNDVLNDRLENLLYALIQ